MRRWVVLMAGGVLVGCSNLTDAGSSVVALEITVPNITALEVGDTTRLSAMALNRDGKEVTAPVAWLAPDATLSVDVEGLVSGLEPGNGRVQARTGSLVSSFVTFTIVARPDTLVLVGDDMPRVGTGQSATPPLVARLDTYDGVDTLPVQGGSIIYEVVEPVFPTPADRTVEFTGGSLIDTVTTGAAGTPTVSVVLNRVASTVSPDSAIVEIRAFRLRGTVPVPGTGQRFIVRFDPS